MTSSRHHFGACEASLELAARDGPHGTFEGSPSSKSSGPGCGRRKWKPARCMCCTRTMRIESPNMNLGTLHCSGCALRSWTTHRLRSCGDGDYELQELHRVTKVATRSLNKAIDRTYPVEGARRSNLRHRPIGSVAKALPTTLQ